MVSARLVATLRGHEAAVDEVRFSPDGALMVSADDEHTVRFWDVRTHTLIRTLDVPASHLTFSPDGALLAWTTTGSAVELRTPEGELITEAPPQGRLATAFAFSPDGTLIATGDKLGRIHLWETATRRLILSFQGTPHSTVESGEAATSPVDALCFGVDGPNRYYLAVASRNPRGNVHLWEVESAGSRATWLATAAGDLDVWAMAVSPDGRMLAVSDFGGGGVHFLDGQTLARRGRVMVEDETFKGIVFSPDGRRVALAGAAGMVYIWDVASQRVVARIEAHTDGADYRTNAESWALGGIDWSPVDGLLVTSGVSPFTLYDSATQRFTGPDDYTVKLWKLLDD